MMRDGIIVGTDVRNRYILARFITELIALAVKSMVYSDTDIFMSIFLLLVLVLQ